MTVEFGVKNMRNSIIRGVAFIEYCTGLLAGRTCGISFIVRYFRNPNPRVTIKLLRAFGASVDRDTTVKRALVIDNTFEDRNSNGDFSHLKIGANCYIGDNCFLDLANQIIIEDNAVISANASFLTHADCGRSPYLSEKFPRKCGPIVVKAGAWVGYGATVFPGVTIGRNAVLGAHSLLLENADPECLYVGIPAKKHRDLDKGQS
jgi:acetyltransferase-like isoleucine patch superfamily enzyme